MLYMYQLCKSLDHMHRNGIFHRDVKPENILIKDVLKLGDFGSCRSVYSKPPYTEYISTRWYRAPECLLTDGFYTHKMDLWSAGCVFYEITSLQPLFPGANELDQIARIHDIVGTPAERTLSKFKQSRAMSFDFPFKKGSGIPLPPASLTPHGLALMRAMVAYDPDDRITARQALQHPCFQEHRAAERQAQAGHRRAVFPEHATAPGLLAGDWRLSREARKQPPGAAPLASFSSPALRAALRPAAGGSIAVLRPLKLAGAHRQVAAPPRAPRPPPGPADRPSPPQTDAREDAQPGPKQHRLPAIGRKGAGR